MTDDKPRITALVGSYRKGGAVDTAVDELLTAARDEGALTEKIYLVDRQIAYCRNCRACAQEEGVARGRCPIADDVPQILDALEQSDALVLASPVNFGTATAVMKAFIERLVCYAYWPWGKPAPAIRNPTRPKRAVLVATSAAPAWLGRFACGIVGLLKKAATTLGAKTVGVLFIGLVGQQPKPEIGARARRTARRWGKRLAQPRSSR